MESLEDDQRPDRDGEEALFAHPDLAAIGKRLRTELDETLRAEQHAARVSAQRRSTLRDRLLLAEDRAECVDLDLTGGGFESGAVLAVGADHVIVSGHPGPCWVAIHHIVGIKASHR